MDMDAQPMNAQPMDAWLGVVLLSWWAAQWWVCCITESHGRRKGQRELPKGGFCTGSTSKVGKRESVRRRIDELEADIRESTGKADANPFQTARWELYEEAGVWLGFRPAGTFLWLRPAKSQPVASASTPNRSAWLVTVFDDALDTEGYPCDKRYDRPTWLPLRDAAKSLWNANRIDQAWIIEEMIMHEGNIPEWIQIQKH